jgi:hypothetical protein
MSVAETLADKARPSSLAPVRMRGGGSVEAAALSAAADHR